MAEKVGGSDLDPYVKQAFENHANRAADPSNHRNSVLVNNCKSEAAKLLFEARKLKLEAEKKKRESQEGAVAQKANEQTGGEPQVKI